MVGLPHNRASEFFKKIDVPKNVQPNKEKNTKPDFNPLLCLENDLQVHPFPREYDFHPTPLIIHQLKPMFDIQHRVTEKREYANTYNMYRTKHKYLYAFMFTYNERRKCFNA